MKISREAGSFITTPIYFGTQEEIRKATSCVHDFAPSGPPERGGPGQKALMQMEHCKACCAVRTRITPAEGATLEDLLREE